MQFDYQARTPEGEIQTGIIEAADRQIAIEVLQRHNLILISLISRSRVSIFSLDIGFLKKVKAKDVVVFSRQLATLVEAKIPLVQSLRVLVKQTSNPKFREVIFEIAADVEGGLALSDALAKHSEIFSNFYVNLVKSGEASGNLDKALTYLADHLEREYDLIQKVKGAMIYPAFILTAFLIIGFLMMVFVVPQLTSFLKETGKDLPFMTKLLMATSDFLKYYFWVIILLGIGVSLWIKRYLKTQGGSQNWDRVKLKIPLIGEIYRKIFVARLMENLSTLIASGLPIIRSLEISGRVVGNDVYKKLLEEAVRQVRAGETIASVFSNSPDIPPMVAQMIEIGERTGQLDRVLKNVSRFYSREVDNAVASLSTLIEPILILILGGAVAVLVASILLPIYNISMGGE